MGEKIVRNYACLFKSPLAAFSAPWAGAAFSAPRAGVAFSAPWAGVAFSAVCALAASAEPASAAEVKEFDSAGISWVEVHSGSGRVELVATESGKSSVTAEKRKFGSHCKMTAERRNETLFVEVEQTHYLASSAAEGCEVDLKIQAPKAAGLFLRSGNGDIGIEGFISDLDFRVGRGSVRVKGSVKRLDGKAGSGDIAIQGLSVGGRLVAGSGKITVAYENAPALGELSIKTGSGDAEISFPQASKIKTSFSAGSGNLVNDLGDTPSSQFTVSMRAGSGSLRIKRL
jgi:hypothetical protein